MSRRAFGGRPMLASRPRLLGVLALAALLPLLAQEPKFAVKGKKCALLVGVKQYKKGELTNLKYTENDVTDLAKLLEDAGYKVVLMTQTNAAASDLDLMPTGENIRRELMTLLKREDDTVLLAFSGHGAQL